MSSRGFAFHSRTSARAIIEAATTTRTLTPASLKATRTTRDTRVGIAASTFFLTTLFALLTLGLLKDLLGAWWLGTGSLVFFDVHRADDRLGTLRTVSECDSRVGYSLT
jgi:hypothetical protein